VAAAAEPDAAEIKASGLLDEVLYLEAHPDVAASAEDAAVHFSRHGWRERRNPNRYFDLAWYEQQMPAGLRGAVNPVLHYAREGERQGLRPVPFFDPAWYRSQYRLSATESPLRHYLTHVLSGQFNPLPEFDVAFYLDRNPRIRAARVDPFVHYLDWGFREGLDPAPGFDSRFYSERYLGGSEAENPLLHYLRQSDRSGLLTSPGGTAPANTPPGLAQDRAERDELRATGLLDEAFYLETHSDVVASGEDPAVHFCRHGWRETRNPNRYFDLTWYQQQMPAESRGAVNPVLHYARDGERRGLRPVPFFDPTWYRAHYRLSATESPLRHYLMHLHSGWFSPIPEFDAEFYVSNYPDVAIADVDPFQHFLHYGWREDRDPSNDFNVGFYIRRYLGGDRSRNPLFHYIAHRHEPGVHGRMPDDEVTIPREIKRFTRPGSDFEEFQPLPKSAIRHVKLLAYYLPQFHTVPENDDWWGKGFTEWANIARGIPRFKGHYQPRIPRDLGFYSLEHPQSFRRQVDMALSGGIFGFIFYYYWFNSKRLLHGPVERFLSDPSVEMPFCLMWANENWTRRWDGAGSEVLISQDYHVDDDEPMVADFARHFADPRYIRVQGRPLLMIYRPALIPDPSTKITQWRHIFQDRFQEDPVLVMAQSFDDTDPRPYGLDGAIEFPPHKLKHQINPINADLELLDEEFKGKAYSYDELVRASLKEPVPPYPLIKTAVPSWDNDARQPGTGLVLTGSTPEKYESWLSRLLQGALEQPFLNDPLVCVNAWNEWCEGAYLEPDLHFGAAYLNATARAVSRN
jgi:hypothetical protein